MHGAVGCVRGVEAGVEPLLRRRAEGGVGLEASIMRADQCQIDRVGEVWPVLEVGAPDPRGTAGLEAIICCQDPKGSRLRC